MNLMRTLLLSVILLLQQPGWAAVTAWLDKKSIADGDTVRLMIEASGDIPGDPDTQALLKDFDIKGIATGHRQTRINGQFNNHTTWTITLRPRQSGVLTVPPILINGEPTKPMSLKVKPNPKAKTAAGEVFIKSEVSNERPFVQSMVIYRVQMIYNIRLAEGSLATPSIRNALVRRLGTDKQHTTTLNGTRYKVIERRYAIFPQTSEPLVIPAAVLDAKIPSKIQSGLAGIDRSGNNPFVKGGGEFDAFITATRPIRVRGKSHTLQVRPQPGSYTGKHWLPARNITLSETVDKEGAELEVGDPVTRTIVLRADGLTAEQLPNLAANSIGGSGIYFDKPALETRTSEASVIGTVTQRIVHVPGKSGTLELPAMEVQWWDTTINSMKTASLPAHRYTVKAKTAEPAVPPTTAPTDDKSPTLLPELKKIPLVSRVAEVPRSASWWSWAAALFAILWLLTTLLWLRERRKRQPDKPVRIEKASSEKAEFARKRFLQACRENLPHPARQYLLQWAGRHWPDHPPAGLEALAQRIDNPKLTPLLQQLDMAVYSSRKMKWKGRHLAARLKRLPRQTKTGSRQSEIPPLYPQT